jgi:hypothetical protein
MRKCLTIILLLAVGCTTSVKQKIKTVMDKYETVNYEDGVDWEEAEIIAQRALVRQNLADKYDLDNPKAVEEVDELPNYADHWFLAFKERMFSSIEYVFVVVIEKESGQVKFADDLQDEKWWILEAALLK